MFLIVASSRGRTETSEPMLVVRCHTEMNGAGLPPLPGGELGIEYRRFGSKTWIRANGPPGEDDIISVAADGRTGEKWIFLPKSAPGQPAEALLICRYPRPGRWEFQAYLADFPSANTALDAPIAVTFEFLGAVQIRSAPNLLLSPGTSTTAVLVELGSTH